MRIKLQRNNVFFFFCFVHFVPLLPDICGLVPASLLVVHQGRGDEAI